MFGRFAVFALDRAGILGFGLLAIRCGLHHIYYYGGFVHAAAGRIGPVNPMATLLIAFGLNSINLQATILQGLMNGCHQRV